MTVKRRLIDEAVHALLVAECPFPVGLATRPELVDPGEPHKYVIVFPAASIGSAALGPNAAPEADIECAYDVRSHGKDRRQAQWVADFVRGVLFSRQPWGAPVHTFEFGEGHAEMGRSPMGGVGAATLTANVWQVVDSFVVTVTREAAA